MVAPLNLDRDWIDALQHQPEEGVPVLVRWKSGPRVAVAVASFSRVGGERHWAFVALQPSAPPKWLAAKVGDITHWMAMPEV